MNAVTYAKTDLESVFNLFNLCAGGMDEAQFNWSPGGTCNPIAKSYVHAMTSADFFVNGIIRSGELSWPKLAQAHGLPGNPLEIWKHRGTIAMAPMLEYGQTVQKSVLEYAGTLKDDELDREIETQFFGKKSVAWLLQLTGTHALGHGGDMAAVKGLQGLKGLPF